MARLTAKRLRELLIYDPTTVNRKLLSLGRFATFGEAHSAYLEAKIKYHGVNPWRG